MNNEILLSVRPQYAELIVEGIKRVELRRTFSKNGKNKKCYIYSSSPTKAVIGECYITDIEELPIDTLWKKYSDDSMIGWKDFSTYFEGKETGYAIKLSKEKKYQNPIYIQDEFKMSRPPQSFCYING